MSFNTKNGTYGAHQPGKVMKFINKLRVNHIARSGKVIGGSGLVLYTVGRKSGVERATPLGWFAGTNGSWLIVAAAAGAANNPAWFFNIAGNPDKVQIEVMGRKIAVTAEQLHGSERAKAWQEITTAVPQFAGYQKKTDREIAVIRLTARG